MQFHYKKFFSYYKPYLRLFLSILMCAFIAAATTLLLPLCIRYITKNVLETNMQNAMREIYKTGILMAVLVLIQLVCNYYYDYRGHSMGAMMERDMRNELFAQYQRLSFRFYDGQKVGKLMSRITNDLLLLSELYHHGPEDYIMYFVKFVGAFTILMTINVKLTLAVFVFLPILAVFSLYINKKINAAINRNYDRIGDVNARIEDNLSGIRVVKSFANEEMETRLFACENDRFLESRKGIYWNESVFYNGVSLVVNLITVTLIIFGGAAIANASLDLADLITFLLYLNNLIEPIQKLAHITVQFQEGIAGFKRFTEMLAIEPDIRDSENAMELKAVKGTLSFCSVGFKYTEGREYVLRNISMDIKAGEYVALVGTSGVGKTTLCSLIPRFYEASEGEVLLDGVNIKDIRLQSLRRNVGVVQQDVYLFAGTVLDNIRYGKPDADMEEIIEAAKKANAHEFIMELPNGYQTDIGQRGVKLSGGQKQRVSIARVFLKNPPILILDEATSALDNESERVIQKSLERLAQNRTTIVIAHRLSTIRNAERIIVLAEQGIEEQGTHEELMASEGIYSHLYNIQAS